MDTSPLIAAVQASLDESLLSVGQRRRLKREGSISPLAGHCSVASEALYHMLGGKAAGWTPQVMRVSETTHWFLRHADGTVIDATADQFETDPDRSLARGCGFPTPARGLPTPPPSRRAQTVIERAQTLLAT
jgi:hypothetical protein